MNPGERRQGQNLLNSLSEINAVTMSSNGTVRLRGNTWNHSRGFLPMVATAQRFSETHPGTEIVWKKRSLQEFADYPIPKLAETFDLLVTDHPFVGYVARHGDLLPLDEHISAGFLADQNTHSVGESHRSYFYGGHQWALAIDAATPVSSWRADLLERANAKVPETWDEVLELASRGMVAIASLPVDSLMNFYMFCCALGHNPFSRENLVVDPGVGMEALTMLRELARRCSPEIFNRNPIATYEEMANADATAYCPFAYSYSNYSRLGYARKQLVFGELCKIGKNGRPRSTLGGTGLAISMACKHREVAIEYACFVAAPECQKRLYVQCGGQPGHRSAWTDEEANRVTSNFFWNTLAAQDRAYMRPRYEGYIDFQDQAGEAVHEFLRSGGNPGVVIKELQQVYERTRCE